MSIQPNMPFMMAPHTYAVVGFAARRNQLLCWEVKATSAVAAYILDEENFKKYEANQNWKWDAGHGRKAIHEGEYEVPEGGDWFLLIHNTGDQDAGVVFDIWTD